MTLHDPEPENRCDHHIWGSRTGLQCQRHLGHDGAHVHLDGSACPDRHTATSKE